MTTRTKTGRRYTAGRSRTLADGSVHELENVDRERDADGCKTRQNATRDRQFFLSAKSIWSDWIDLAQARYGIGLRAAKCVRRGQARSGRGDRTWADRLDGRPSGFCKTMLASSVRLDHPGAIA